MFTICAVIGAIWLAFAILRNLPVVLFLLAIMACLAWLAGMVVWQFVL